LCLGGADKKLDSHSHGLRKELNHYVFSRQNQHCVTGLSSVWFCNQYHPYVGLPNQEGAPNSPDTELQQLPARMDDMQMETGI